MEYFPIELKQGASSDSGSELPPTSFTQMYIGVQNTGSNQSISLDEVQIKYWFDGPLSESTGTVSAPQQQGASANQSAFRSSGGTLAKADPNQFTLTCSDISPGIGEG